MNNGFNLLYDPDMIYHYAAWRTDDSGDQLSEGVSDSANTRFSWQVLPPTVDGWVDSYMTANFDADYFRISGPSSSPKYVGLLKFDIPPSGAVGYLAVTPYSGTGGVYAYLNRIVQDWDEGESGSSLYGKANSPTFYDPEHFSGYMYTDGFQYNVWINNMVYEWATGAPNFGIRMQYELSGSWELYIRSSEYSYMNYQPKLHLYSSEEFR